MTIPIVFSANDYFIPYTAVSIQSIMAHANKENDYRFYILHRDISDKFIRLLYEQTSQFPNCSIDFINVSEYISAYAFFVSRHISVETYFRLLIPYILMDYDKVIYLDGDILCLVDISELYKIELNNHLLSAVRDIGVSWYYSPSHSKYRSKIYQVLLHLKNPEDYFNGGVIVFDTGFFRKIFTLKYLFEFAVSSKFQIHDQDVLNILCEEKVCLLPFTWNLMKTPDSIYLPEHLKKQYVEAENNPKIIHFKPWARGNYSPYLPFSELFWKYATQTPFYDLIISRMKEQKILATHSIRDQIFLDIKNRNNCGMRFIIKCLFIWIISRFKKISK
jgi:lipopolysaccharide biosynthesis glycosyltransferase